MYEQMMAISSEKVRQCATRAGEWFARQPSSRRRYILRTLANMPTSPVGLLGRTRFYLMVQFIIK